MDCEVDGRGDGSSLAQQIALGILSGRSRRCVPIRPADSINSTMAVLVIVCSNTQRIRRSCAYVFK